MKVFSNLCILLLLWLSRASPFSVVSSLPSTTLRERRALVAAVTSKAQTKEEDLEAVTQKYGLEWGMFKALTSKSQTIKPKDLLKKYGVAYLLTSISLALLTFAASFFLVSRGVDVVSLLQKIGIKATAATANAGTVGIAYAIHKAASPIRFPPTVVLTPIVASWIAKRKEGDREEEKKFI